MSFFLQTMDPFPFFWERPFSIERARAGDQPRARLEHDENEIRLLVDLPGAKKGDVTVSLRKGTVEVKWKRGSWEGTYSRYVGDVESGATAKLEDGVLTVRMRPLDTTTYVKVE